MNDDDVVTLFAPPILTLVFLGIGYLWARTTRRGRPLTRLQRGMILYAVLFVFGMEYLIMFQDELGAFLHWKSVWIAAGALWGMLLAVIAWWRNHAIRAR